MRIESSFSPAIKETFSHESNQIVNDDSTIDRFENVPSLRNGKHSFSQQTRASEDINMLDMIMYSHDPINKHMIADMGKDLSIDGTTVYSSSYVNRLSGSTVEPVTISSQKQLLALQGATKLKGIFHLTGDIHSLYPLSQVQEIDGDLYFENLPLLKNLSGLENLTTISGDLMLSNLDQLSSLQALSNLAKVYHIKIHLAHALTSLDGLQALTKLFKVSIIDCKKLENVTGLDNCTRIMRFELNQLPSLKHLDSLHNVENIDQLYLKNLTSLKSIIGLSGLNSFGTHIELFNLSSLQKAAVFKDLEMVVDPDVIIKACPQLSFFEKMKLKFQIRNVEFYMHRC